MPPKFKVEQYNLIQERLKRQSSIFTNPGFYAFLNIVFCILTLYFCHLYSGDAKASQNVYLMRHFHYNKMILATTSNFSVCILLVNMLKHNCNIATSRNFIGNTVNFIFIVARALITAMTFLVVFNMIKLQTSGTLDMI